MFHRAMNYGELELRPGATVTKDLIKKHMPKYKRHDDLIIIQESAWDEFQKLMPLPVVKDENSPFSIDEHELASLVCQSIHKPICRRLAIERGVRDDAFRSPNIQLLLGDNGVVNHKDNHILYRFDVTKCMFSFGNVREKMRMAEIDCSDEIVVDLFAGIGYFTLPLLVHAKAKHLFACEWNPDAVGALRENLKTNKVEPDRYTVIEGDNRLHAPNNVAQRVILGILPSCKDWMETALDCVDKKTGAILHCHDLVETRSTPSTSPNSTNNSNNSAEKQDLTDSNDCLATKDRLSKHSGNHQNIKQAMLADTQSALNQSISSSSTSSHSTIEKISVPNEDFARVLQLSESDKETGSSGALDKTFGNSWSTNSPSDPPCFETSAAAAAAAAATNNNSSNDRVSITSSNNEDSIIEPPQIADSLTGCYESRGLALIDCISQSLEKNNLTARLLHIQPVKSYAPHINHVVFDIQIEPRRCN